MRARSSILVIGSVLAGFLGAAPAAQASSAIADTLPGAGNSFVRVFGDEVNPDRWTIVVRRGSVLIRADRTLRVRNGCRRITTRSASCPATSARRLVLYLPLYAGNDRVTITADRSARGRRIELRYVGGRGNDTLIAKVPVRAVTDAQTCATGDAGNDRLVVPAVPVTARDCDLEGGPGNDVLTSGEAYGQEGRDRLTGTTGGDELDGGTGDDVLSGGAGRDILQGDDGRDVVLGGTGRDVLDGGTGDDRLDGGSGDDDLLGGRGHDALGGGPGDDVLRAYDADGSGLQETFEAEGNVPAEPVDCGAGFDTVAFHDRADLLNGCETAAPLGRPIAPTTVVGPGAVTVRGACPEDWSGDTCVLTLSLRAPGPLPLGTPRPVFGSVTTTVPSASPGVDVAVPLTALGQQALAGGAATMFVDHEVAPPAPDQDGAAGGFSALLRR